MRISLELVVIAIIILVVAVVVLAIFGGGIENFLSLFGYQSDEHIKYGLCASACSNYCFTHPNADSVTWEQDGLKKPLYKGDPVDCGKIYKATCDCKK